MQARNTRITYVRTYSVVSHAHFRGLYLMPTIDRSMSKWSKASRSESSSSADSSSSSSAAPRAAHHQPVNERSHHGNDTDSTSSTDEEEEGITECPPPDLHSSTVDHTTRDHRKMEYPSSSDDNDRGQEVEGGKKRKRRLSDPTFQSPPNKQPAPNYSAVSLRMMESMGYKTGQGLGRSGDGITAPISQSSQLGRRGFGYAAGGLERENVKWEEEEVNIHQKIEWLECTSEPIPDESELRSWLVQGQRKSTIAGETHFTDPNILNSILENKSMFDSLSNKEFLNARQRSNPYETIKGAFFQNRAAMKMANIDAVTGFMFTDPRNHKGASLGLYDVLYFADICAGPGGFSEYVLWRKKWHAKGFGFTLKDPASGSDFKLDAFTSPCETFDPHYGVGGYQGDGDITKPENQSEFKKYVLDQSENRGVHFVMADGGISVEGQENIQELLLKQLVLCQYLTILHILRPGGCCVVKVFDMFTMFSVGLFYLLYRSFHRIALFKPVTSRPANSERYVICEGLRDGCDCIADYMTNINIIMCQLQNIDRDILEVAPVNLMKYDETFYTYITAFNDSFGHHQVTHLQKLQYFVKNSSLMDTRQADIRRRCLHLWKIPDIPRTTNTILQKPEQVFFEQWQYLYGPKSDEGTMAKMSNDIHCLQSDQFPTVSKDTLEFLRGLHSWKWCWASGKRMMVVGLGRNRVFGWEMRDKKPEFNQRSELSRLELPPGTVLEIECVQELQGEGSGQRKSDVIYILDVLSIYNEFYGLRPLKERQLYGEKLAKVLNKPCQKIMLRAKKHHRVADLSSQDTFPKLKLRLCKGRSWKIPTVAVEDNNSSRFLAPVGIIFFKTIKDPWQLHIGSRGFYYYNAADNKSTYDCPTGSVASFLDGLKSRHLWRWDKAIFTSLCSYGDEEDEGQGTDILTPTILSTTLTHFMT